MVRRKEGGRGRERVDRCGGRWIKLYLTFSPPGGIDYAEANVRFEFSDVSPTNYTFNITILDDEIVEGLENFSVVLSTPEDIAEHVFFYSQESLIQIMDEDGKKIALFPYSTHVLGGLQPC